MKKGLFIVFEGLDGSGKSTQAALLCRALAERGFDAVLTREPTDSRWGMQIRRIAAEGRAGTSLDEEIDLFVQDRREHVRELVRPALRRGAVVVSDRYYYSNIAYQGALGADPAAVRRINERRHRFPRPDVVFFIDIDPRTGIRRINSKRDGANTGYEREDFLVKVKGIFDSFEDDNFVRIKGAQRPEAIARTVRKKVLELLEGRGD